MSLSLLTVPFSFSPQLLMTYYLAHDLIWLILLVIFVDHCHETRSAAPVHCPKFTKAHGHCIVDRAVAFDICAVTPGCKYVLTTINAEWNKKFSDAVMLGKDPLDSNSEWKSCELPTATCKCLNSLLVHILYYLYCWRSVLFINA